ncbi:MAG: BirA family biotin operon repressor/biotin-[acetyl-CoA-carboxylase] ligase [Paraglaciecola sp.]|jgi:BirA family biotin operon repressor/biotin-[acetyl-CoA-carboxylase] ligase
MSKHTDTIRSQIVVRLASGNFCSGEALGEELGISRAAISGHIKTLTALGLDIFSVTGKGYKLAGALQLLDGVKIAALRADNNPSVLEVLNVIDSTNQYLKGKLAQLDSGHACIAEAQTAGRGRHGRTWVSPFGASLYLSIYWSFTGGYQVVGGLSLAVGVAVVSALTKSGVSDVQLKWPNDIYAQGKKLAGVLIEAEGQVGGVCECVLGIGLNIALPGNTSGIDQPWIDLAQLSSDEVDRNKLAAYLLEELQITLEKFEEFGLEPFVETWRALDVYCDKPIKLSMGQKTIQGICRGINNSGALLLEADGEIRAYHGGEISVRKA